MSLYGFNSLAKLADRELLLKMKNLVQEERTLLTQVLEHLREVERRKLFCDLGYQSLFEYAVKELKYSEGQAGRRIQAMRLIKELPEVEKKIESGALSLSNLSQAQSFFRENKSHLTSAAKVDILTSLENKSAREGQKILLQLPSLLGGNLKTARVKEKERVLDEARIEITFILNEELKSQLEEVRSFLGIKGIGMGFVELLNVMSRLSLIKLKEQKFGKKRLSLDEKTASVSKCVPSGKQKVTSAFPDSHPQAILFPASSIASPTSIAKLKSESLTTPTLEKRPHVNSRYISKEIKSKLWQRYKGKCQNCGSCRNLNIDHIKPLGLGGKTELENLRLLCFHCNQRQAYKTYGLNFIYSKFEFQ